MSNARLNHHKLLRSHESSTDTLQILLDPLVLEDTEPYVAGRVIGSPIRDKPRLLHRQVGPSSKDD